MKSSPLAVDRAASGWRIVISPQDYSGFPSCYHSSMRNLAVLFIHLIATLARLLGPGGVRSVVAELLLLNSSAPFRNCTEALDTA